MFLLSIGQEIEGCSRLTIFEQLMSKITQRRKQVHFIYYSNHRLLWLASCKYKFKSSDNERKCYKNSTFLTDDDHEHNRRHSRC